MPVSNPVPFEQIEVRTEEVGHNDIAEHGAILDAIDSGDAELAGRLAAEHITNAREARIAVMRGAV